MVEQRTLTPLVLVRIQVPQPTWTKACIFLQAFVFIEFFEFERSIFRTTRKTVFFDRKPLIFRRFADFCRFTVLRTCALLFVVHHHVTLSLNTKTRQERDTGGGRRLFYGVTFAR